MKAVLHQFGELTEENRPRAVATVLPRLGELTEEDRPRAVTRVLHRLQSLTTKEDIATEGVHDLLQELREEEQEPDCPLATATEENPELSIFHICNQPSEVESPRNYL